MQIKIKKKKNKNKNFEEKYKIDFWCKKFEKCKMKIKKISPTPKSITHKKPTKISLSSNNKKKPKDSKYKPAKYHTVKIFIELIKKKRITKVNICSKKKTFNS